jgi:hypothetical protein
MAFSHGKGAAFSLDNATGTLTDISTYLDEISFPSSIETGETTTFQSPGAAKTYVPGLRDATFSLSGKFDPTVDALFEGLIAAQAAGSAAADFAYGPAGSASAAVKYEGAAWVTGYDISTPVADVVTFSVDLQVTGQVTRGTF